MRKQRLGCILGISNHLFEHPLRGPAKEQRAGVSMSGPEGPISTALGFRRSALLRGLWVHLLLLCGEASDNGRIEPVLPPWPSLLRGEHASLDPAAHCRAVHLELLSGLGGRQPIAVRRRSSRWRRCSVDHDDASLADLRTECTTRAGCALCAGNNAGQSGIHASSSQAAAVIQVIAGSPSMLSAKD